MNEKQMSQNFAVPFHFELLSQEDVKDYIKMRNDFSIEVNKSKKGERRESFINTLKVIRSYIERDDTDDWKRAMVCGVIFLNCGNNTASLLSSAVAINIQQLRVLLGKCKSSINGSLQQLGYQSLPASPIGKLYEEVLRKVPYFQQDLTELKKWTFRENESLSRFHNFTLPQIDKSLYYGNQPFQQKTLLYVDLGQRAENACSTTNSCNSSTPFICPLPIIRSQKEVLPTPLISITSPSTPPEPSSGFFNQTQSEVTISVNDIRSNTELKFPCPVKFRYKYLSTISASSH